MLVCYDNHGNLRCFSGKTNRQTTKTNKTIIKILITCEFRMKKYLSDQSENKCDRPLRRKARKNPETKWNQNPQRQTETSLQLGNCSCCFLLPTWYKKKTSPVLQHHLLHKHCHSHASCSCPTSRKKLNHKLNRSGILLAAWFVVESVSHVIQLKCYLKLQKHCLLYRLWHRIPQIT